MPDLKRQLAAARNERDQLRREIQHLRTIMGEIDPAYSQAFADICDLAIYGMRRPDDLGKPITTNHASSTPPRYHPGAYHDRNEERREQRRRAAQLRSRLEAYTEGRHTPAS